MAAAHGRPGRRMGVAGQRTLMDWPFENDLLFCVVLFVLCGAAYLGLQRRSK